MIDLFFYPQNLLFVVFFVLLLLFAVQGSYLCINLLNFRLREKYMLLGEGLLLVHIAMMAMTIVTVMVNVRHDVIDLANYDKILYLSAAFSIGYFAYSSVKKVAYSILALVATTLTLPVVAQIIENGYIIFLLISVVILYYRIISLIYDTLKRQRNELNAFSVIDGLNTLPCGVLFCDARGYVFLTNVKMMELATEFMETEPKNGLIFWDKLQSSHLHNVESQMVEGDVLLRTSNSAWRFSKQQFSSGGVQYIEITAIDVTESIGAFYALEEENKKLEQQSAEIQKLTENIEALQREREYSRIRSRVHDVLGQRLTAIQKIMQSGEEPDYDMLLFLSEDAIANIKERKGGNAKELFSDIYQYFHKIGLDIKLYDPLPKDEQIAFLFLSVLREASTNAIKHAAATKVYAKIKETDGNYRIEITNNGERPKKSIIEGGGLFGIRGRVENAGGVLRVELIPEFSLIITISRGSADDKGFYS